VFNREADVSRSLREEARKWITAGGLCCLDHLLFEQGESVFGDSGQKRGLIREVTVGSGVSHSCTACSLAQREARYPVLGDQLEGCRLEGPGQIPVMISRFRSRHRHDVTASYFAPQKRRPRSFAGPEQRSCPWIAVSAWAGSV